MNQLPSFLCVGTQKAGTSWLYEQLRQHPSVWMPPIKELHYFDHLYCAANQSWTKWHIEQGAKKIIRHQIEHGKPVDFTYIRYIAAMACKPMFTEQWYRQAFDRPAAKGKILGDITPEYCAIGDDGIAYVKRLLGDVNILWIVRDPVERALSQLRMNAERRGVSSDAPLDTWMELAGSAELLDRGDYCDYMPRWEKAFGRQAILFVPFKHIAEQPQQVLSSVETFIGASHWHDYPAPDKKIHASKAFAVPVAVADYFKERFQPQYRFLEGYFDTDFVGAI